MAKKIVLFLSVLNPRGTSAEYACPDGDSVLVQGDWSNEAPLRYLLRAHPDVTEIVAITTARAEEETMGQLLRLASEHRASVVSIPYSEDASFRGKMLREILQHFTTGDELLFDITGGMRDAVIYLLLISQTLSYGGCKRIGAVYGNLGTKRIENAEPMLGLFELLDGMKEFVSFGSVRTLRDYYAKLPPDASSEAMERLLDTTQKMTEAVSLCRTGALQHLMTEFNEAMQAAQQCDDPLLCKLLQIFQEKFGQDLSIFSLIRWCVENGMLQQALTIYVESMPEQIFKTYLEGDLPAIKRRTCEKLQGFDLQCYQQNPAAFLLHDGILKAVDWDTTMVDEKDRVLLPVLDFAWEYRMELKRANSIQDLEAMGAEVEPYYREAFENLFYLKRVLYQHDSSRIDFSVQLLPEKNYLYSLFGLLRHGPDLPQNEFVLKITSSGILFDSLNPYEKRVQTWCVALNHLGGALKLAGPYRVKAPYSLGDLRTVLRQHLYLKQVRNQVNHAMNLENPSETYADRYFARFNFPPSEHASAREICAQLEDSISNIDRRSVEQELL